MDVEYMKESIAVLYEANEKLRAENEALKAKLDAIREPLSAAEVANVFSLDDSPVDLIELIHQAILARIEEE